MWGGLKRRVWEPWEECVQVIIDVMNGKAGERKVGTDGVKDRSLRGRQKKENAMKRKSLCSFSNSWHWQDTADYKLMPRMLRHSVAHCEAWWVHEGEKREEKRVKKTEQNWIFPTTMRQRGKIRGTWRNKVQRMLIPIMLMMLRHFLPLFAAGSFSAAVCTGHAGLE